MTLAQALGLLEEELHKFSYEIEVFDREYLLDKIIEFTSTINREAIRSNQGHSELYSLININEEDSTHELNDGRDNRVFKVHELLSGVNDKETSSLQLVRSNIRLIVGRASYLSYMTKDHARYSKGITSYTVLGKDRILITKCPSDFNLSNIDDELYLRAVLADQRDLYATELQKLNMELKVASEVKLHTLIKKDILILLSDGNTDSNERKSGES